MTREEAIKIIKRNCTSGNDLRKACELFIPELTENEDETENKDERIRRAIIELLKEVGRDDTGISENAKCMIAYLERQKDSVSNAKYIEDVAHAFEDGRKKGIEEEQKPVEWSEEDEKKYQSIRSILLTDVDKKVGSWKYSEILEWYEKRGSGRYTNSQHSWKPIKEQKYDGNMDKECIKLCDILNFIPSIDTFESCCGHLKDRYSIWFFCDDIITISRLGRCVERNYSDGKWELLVDSIDTHPTGVFWLRSKVPFESYDEMEKSVNELCNNIQYWLTQNLI